MDKSKLINNLIASRETFLNTLGNFTPTEIVTLTLPNNWLIKDVIVHLTLWEGQLVTLLWQAKRYRHPTTIHFEKNFSVDKINQEWYIEHKNRDAEQILSDFKGVREQTLRRVRSFSEKELIDPNLFSWLKNKPLWVWVANDSYEHEEEHLKAILALMP